LVNKDQSSSNSDMTPKMKSKPKILIVEDEMITANATKRTLELLNYSVPRVISSAQEAIKETEENTYDLILMDIKLQGQKDGIKAASQIRARHDIPVVYITASTDKKTLEKAKVTEPYGYAYKPIDEKELRTVIEIALLRHDMEQQLKKSEDRYRSIFEGSRDAIFIVAEDSRFVEVNQAASALTGYSKEELLKMKVQDLHDAEGLEVYNHNFLRIMSGVQITSEAKILRKDGTNVDTEFSNKRTEIGGIPFMHTVARDITQRRKAEEELIRLSQAVKMSSDSIIISDINGNILDVNNATLRMYGTDNKDIFIGKNSFDFIAPKDRKKALENMESTLKKEYSPVIEYHLLTQQGRQILVEMSAALIKNNSGQPIGFIKINRDISARKRAEEQKEVLQAQLIHSEKMAGIGTLTSGVAHEFNNLLQIIKGHMEFARRTRRSEDFEEAIETALFTSDRAAKIVKDLLIFASDEVPEKGIVPITEVVESALALLEEHIKRHNIEVVRKYQKNPNVEINKTEMQQVFFNLITNARDAMTHKGGKLEIKVNRIKERVEVSFSDTGIGISEKNLGRVFEPFFTTKGAIGGSKIPGIGLGLSVAYGIVKRHGGIIEVKSQAGKGSTVTVKLPIVAFYGKEKKLMDKKIRGQKELKTRNFLAVDDEEEICQMIAKWLSEEGHKVKYAMTGNEAIALVRKEFFDLVLLDIVMPGMPPLDVLENIAEISPKTKVIMMTGKLIDKNRFNEFRQRGASGYLQKPFKIKEVLNFIS